MKIDEISRQKIIDDYLDDYLQGIEIPKEILEMIKEFTGDKSPEEKHIGNGT